MESNSTSAPGTRPRPAALAARRLHRLLQRKFAVTPAWQAGITAGASFIEAQDDSGSLANGRAGHGIPRRAFADHGCRLTGKLPHRARFIGSKRIYAIYWDHPHRYSADDVEFTQTEVPLAQANLAFRGYPRVVEGNPKNDLTYVYEDVSATGPYSRQTGNYALRRRFRSRPARSTKNT